MNPVQLRQLRDAADPKWAAIAFWTQEGGRKTIEKIAFSKGCTTDRIDEVRQRVILELYEAGGPSAGDAFSKVQRGDLSGVEGLAVRITERVVSLKSNANARLLAEIKNDSLDEKHELIADEQAVDPLAGIEVSRISKLLIDGFAHAVTPTERAVIQMHDFCGLTFQEIADEQKTSSEAPRKAYKRGREKLCQFVADSEAGQHCARTSDVFLLAFSGVGVEPARLKAARDHAEHCDACKAVLAESRRALGGAALLYPLPVVIIAGREGGLIEFFQSLWASVTQRTSEFAAPILSHPAAQVSRPVAAGGVILALVAGGGGAYKITQEVGEGSKQQAPPAAIAAPKEAPPVKPAPEAKEPAKKKRKKRKKQEAPKAAPAPAQSAAPAAAPQQGAVDDGSSEFAPESR